MAEREVKQWVTINGVHIPIYEGETMDDAIKRRQIKQGEDEKDKKESEAPKINEFNKDGSITMTYVRMKGNKTANYGTKYGQNLEPAGEYMLMDTMAGANKIATAEYGTIHFKNPLVLEWKSTDDKGWKKDLSDKFGGKTGKSLSNAIKKAGYDAVMTYEIYKGRKEWSEIVNLSGKKK